MEGDRGPGLVRVLELLFVGEGGGSRIITGGGGGGGEGGGGVASWVVDAQGAGGLPGRWLWSAIVSGRGESVCVDWEVVPSTTNTSFRVNNYTAGE